MLQWLHGKQQQQHVDVHAAGVGAVGARGGRLRGAQQPGLANQLQVLVELMTHMYAILVGSRYISVHKVTRVCIKSFLLLF